MLSSFLSIVLSTLSLILILCRIVISWEHRSVIIIVISVRSTDEVGTGTPSEHDGKDKSITPRVTLRKTIRIPLQYKTAGTAQLIKY